jgi:endoglucanase
MLHTAPGANPLAGARFFVDGPRNGVAAGEIARLLGINPRRYSESFSWAQFRKRLIHGRLARKLRHHPGLHYKVLMLSKIASQPEPMRFSAYSGGGSPSGIYSQVQKIYCHNLRADRGAIPIFTTYFLHPDVGRCPSAAQIAAVKTKFEHQILAMALAVGRRPAVFLLEIDAIGSSHCMVVNHDLPQYLSLLRFEAKTLAALPHTVVYEEAGYSDADSPSYAASALKQAGVRYVRGFFTNDTHLNWTINEVRWGQKISRMTGGAHFIVNTAQNGRGPLKNPHPGRQGIEDLCNPPGRGLGPRDTTETGFAGVDAFLWTYVPGNSSGCGGGPPGGVFWPARAIGLASRANAKLGPGYPSKPY